MAKLLEAIREEVHKQARKEMRQALAPLNKKIAGLRKSLADANKRIAQLEKRTKRQQRVIETSTEAPALAAAPPPEVDSNKRLSAGLIKKLRKRLGISQGELAILVGVSQPAVASWEQDRANPRSDTRARIIALRELSPAEVKEQLAPIETKTTS